jgi:glycosyltransferase involved in cell wall biosynthesis
MVAMISFIIPARNEEVLLGQTLDAIVQAVPELTTEYEIIVVNDGSTDSTASIARSKGAKVIDVELHKISAVRNAGAKQARGDLFVFVDADTQVNANVLLAAQQAIAAGAVGGGARIECDAQTPRLARAVIWIFMLFWFTLARWAAGCFVFARRDAFEKAGGFDERYYATEEMHISRALKRQGAFKIVRGHVVTSGRKVRMYTLGQNLFMIVKFIFRGMRGYQRPEGLGYWYDAKRESAKTTEEAKT